MGFETLIPRMYPKIAYMVHVVLIALHCYVWKYGIHGLSGYIYIYIYVYYGLQIDSWYLRMIHMPGSELRLTLCTFWDSYPNPNHHSGRVAVSSLKLDPGFIENLWFGASYPHKVPWHFTMLIRNWFWSGPWFQAPLWETNPGRPSATVLRSQQNFTVYSESPRLHLTVTWDPIERKEGCLTGFISSD